MATKPERFKYVQTCSRCDGSGVDPDDETLACDCCDAGVEELTLTESEATYYPNATRA